MVRTAAAALAFLLLAGIGCGGSDSTTIEIETSSGETAKVTAGKVSLPPNFPGDVPTPPDSTVAMTFGQGEDLVVTFQAKGTVAATVAFYEERMAAEGWTLEPTVTVNGTSAVISGKKGERTCGVLINGEEGEILVQVSMTVE